MSSTLSFFFFFFSSLSLSLSRGFFRLLSRSSSRSLFFVFSASPPSRSRSQVSSLPVPSLPFLRPPTPVPSHSTIRQPPHPPRPPLQPHLFPAQERPGQAEEARQALAALERARRGAPGRGPPGVLRPRVAVPELEQADEPARGGAERLRQALEALRPPEQAGTLRPRGLGVPLPPRGPVPLRQRDLGAAERDFRGGEAREAGEAPPLGQQAEGAAQGLGDQGRARGITGAVAVEERHRGARVFGRRRRRWRRRREEEPRPPVPDEALDRRQLEAGRRKSHKGRLEGVPGAAGGTRGLRSVPRRRQGGLHAEEGGRVEVHRHGGRCRRCCCSCCPGVRRKRKKTRERTFEIEKESASFSKRKKNGGGGHCC